MNEPAFEKKVYRESETCCWRCGCRPLVIKDMVLTLDKKRSLGRAGLAWAHIRNECKFYPWLINSAWAEMCQNSQEGTLSQETKSQEQPSGGVRHRYGRTNLFGPKCNLPGSSRPAGWAVWGRS